MKNIKKHKALLAAAKIIHEECKKNPLCSLCPFQDGHSYNCPFGISVPAYWNMESLERDYEE